MPRSAREPKERDFRGGLRPPIPQRALVVSLPFSPRLRAGKVAEAVAAGLRAGGSPDPDVLALGDDLAGFDERLRSARAVVLAARLLERDRLRGTLELEILSRARQTGVPAYAICRELRLDAFDARLLDLQVVLEARSERALSAAARRLAPLL
jgi:hypothetical protein